MKTPEEIKRMVNACAEFSSCFDCPFDSSELYCDQSVVIHCADILINSLEADREALLKIAHDYAGCSECIHVDNKPELPPCSDCGVLGKNWVWRGAGKEQMNANA